MDTSTPERISYKDIILSRFSGEFLQATAEDFTIKKTSEQIILDLRPLAEFSINEIAEFLIKMGYSIDFEDSNPFWLMRKEPGHEIS